MKYLISIFILFLIFNQKGYSQETKISLSKNDFASDTQCVYTFYITPFKGDSIYSFKIYLVDSLSYRTEIISSATISVMLRRIEKEVFYKDKFGNKRAKFNFEYYIKNNEEYSDDYLKIPVSINKRTLEGNIILKSGKRYIFVFGNSKEVTERFDLTE